jgi:hypothetical protein
MDEGRRRRGQVTERGERQRRAASKRGGATVKQAFAEVLTRRLFAERVGIHRTTVRRWEALGIITPTPESVLGIPTLVFTEADVEFGKALAQVLASRPGELTLHQAAELVRRTG